MWLKYISQKAYLQGQKILKNPASHPDSISQAPRASPCPTLPQGSGAGGAKTCFCPYLGQVGTFSRTLSSRAPAGPALTVLVLVDGCRAELLKEPPPSETHLLGAEAGYGPGTMLLTQVEVAQGDRV